MNVADDGRTPADNNVFANRDALANRRADSDPRPGTNGNIARKIGARRYVDAICKYAVVIDCACRIQDHTPGELGPGVDDDARAKNRTNADTG